MASKKARMGRLAARNIAQFVPVICAQLDSNASQTINLIYSNTPRLACSEMRPRMRVRQAARAPGPPLEWGQQVRSCPGAPDLGARELNYAQQVELKHSYSPILIGLLGPTGARTIG